MVSKEVVSTLSQWQAPSRLISCLSIQQENGIFYHYKRKTIEAKVTGNLDYINSEHLEQNLSLAELAAVVQLSSDHFARVFKQSMGISPASVPNSVSG